MKIIFNQAGLFILLCCLEVLLPIFAPDSPINSLVFWYILGISLFYAFKLLGKVRSIPYFKSLYLLLILFVVYGLIYYIDGPNYISPATGDPLHKLSYTTAILKSLLPVFPIYFYSKKGLITDKFIKIWIIPFLFVAVIYYFDQLQAALLRHLMDDDVTNNGGYFIASLIPLVIFVSPKKIIQYTYLLICLMFVIYSMKRGAVLFSGLMVLIYFYNSMAGLSSQKKMAFILSFSILIFGVYLFVSRYMMDNLYFLERIQDTLEGNTSDRDSLYGEFIQHVINKANVIQQLFGGGANYTLSVSFNYAHNDWIEILVNQGFFGVIIFFIYWKSFYKAAFFSNVTKEYRIVLQMLFIGYLARTIFSMSYTEYNIFVNLSLGFCLSKICLNNSLQRR